MLPLLNTVPSSTPALLYHSGQSRDLFNFRVLTYGPQIKSSATIILSRVNRKVELGKASITIAHLRPRISRGKILGAFPRTASRLRYLSWRCL